MSVAVSCLTAALIVAVVAATDPQTSDNLQPDDDRLERGFRFVTQNSCDGYSGYSTAYFQSPDKFQEICSYKINIRPDACQIRIDFEKFSIGQPTKRHNGSAYYCERDEFTLISTDGARMNLPALCGENSGQHVYVPVNQQTSSNSRNRQHVTLRFELAARHERFAEPEPSWKLKISQLKCPNTQTSWSNNVDIARQVWDWIEGERDVRKRSVYSLAPDGCLQYFTDQKGSFESFNYNRGMGHYVANLNYAVCFKRQQDSCGIRHEAVGFQVAYRQNLTDHTDRDCDTAARTDAVRPLPLAAGAPAPATNTVRPHSAESLGIVIFFDGAGIMRVGGSARDAGRRGRDSGTAHGDYLMVPDGTYSGDRLPASKYCGDSMEKRADHVASTAQGPLFVTFVSDDHSNPSMDVEKGFKINYSIINSGC